MPSPPTPPSPPPSITVSDQVILTEAMIQYAIYYYLASIGITISASTAVYTVTDPNWNDPINVTKPVVTIVWTP